MRAVNFKAILRKWHRYVGLIVSLFLLELSVTGWLLNHTDSFNLSDHFIESPWLLKSYGIQPGKLTSIQLDEQHWLTQVDDQWFLNDEFWVQSEVPWVDAVWIGDEIILAASHRLWSLDRQGRQLWMLDDLDGLPMPVRALAVTRKGVVYFKAGTPQAAWWQLQTEHLSWQPVHSVPVSMTRQNTKLPESLHRRIQEKAAGRQITLERWLLDLHSGRLFKTPLVMDVIAALMAVLAISGVWLFVRLRR